MLANAKALVFAGLWFEGPEADRWLETGLSIYARELPEQILDDGAHFELSPMYHAIILEDLLDLINVGRTYGFRRSQGILRSSRDCKPNAVLADCDDPSGWGAVLLQRCRLRDRSKPR